MRERPVEAKEFISVLKKLGFTQKKARSTAHEQWEHTMFHGQRRVVTVDAHIAPFTRSLLRSMIGQAGLTKKEFFRCLENLQHCDSLRKKYDPEFA